MTVLAYVLEGLAEELQLERELGVRSLEVDRSLLASVAEARRPVSVAAAEEPKTVSEAPKAVAASSSASARPAVAERPKTESAEGAARAGYDFVFLHDKAFTADAEEMMTKIRNAIGRTPETAPTIISAPLPKAKAYVVLGSLALKRFFPEIGGAPGQWKQGPNGEELYITYSPQYILRFKTVTDSVQRMKKSLWYGLKTVMQKTRGA